MSIFRKFKNFIEQVNTLEYTLSANKQDYFEVYERNIQLEQEITQRTKELNQANKTLLNLQNIWEMMNSSQPLSIIFDNIVGGLQRGLDYHMSVIIQNKEADGEKFFQIKAYIENNALNEISHLLTQPINHYKLRHTVEGEIDLSIKTNRIRYTRDVKGLILSLIPHMPDNYFKNSEIYAKTKSIIILPLYSNSEPFGAILVFSPREEPSESEHTFLNLFDYQTELAITIANLFEEVKKQAVTDPLTDLYNRRYFEEALERERERASRSKQPFSMISIDLDHLKKINDTKGHAAGDLAIKAVAKVLKSNARAMDTPARLGGEEFCILLPGVDTDNACVAAERIRVSIETEKVEGVGKVTASIGIATFGEHTENVEELVDMADQAMYRAKINGRNQVQVAKSKDDTNWQETAIQAFIEILSKKRIPISKNVASDICKQLQVKSVSDTTTRDMLFSTVDTIASSYNELHHIGVTKSKVNLAVKIAKKLELPKEEIDRLRIAMLLYDIGNALLPEEIFKKKEPLTTEEKEQIHTHPIIAARKILKPISVISDVLPVVEHHHENWDGSGYPSQISGEEIPTLSQIILLVDAFSALTQNRPYRVALSQDEAVGIIKKDVGKKWSQDLIDLFDELLNVDILSEEQQ